MENSLAHSPQQDPPFVQGVRYILDRAWATLLANFVVCSLVTLFVWLFIPTIGQYGFKNNWVFSQCIGQTICLFYLLTVWLNRQGVELPAQFNILIHSTSIFVGFLIGSQIGSFLLGIEGNFLSEKNLLLSSLVITVLVSVSSMWFYSTYAKMAQLKLAAAEEAARSANAHFSMLQAQVEPHMLFNTLSNLRVLINRNPQQAQFMLDQLMLFLRATLAGSQTSYHSLEQEFEVLNSYLAIMQIRLGARLHYSLKLQPSAKQYFLPTLLLQPLVENAVLHGIEPCVKGGSITVQATLKNQQLYVVITDSGCGFETSTNAASGRFGLNNLQDRLNLLNKQCENMQLDACATLNTYSPPKTLQQGTQMVITLPILNQELS